MSQTIKLLGATYSDVPAVTLPTESGTATFTDTSDTTATASDVASGKYFYTADGTRTSGTKGTGSVQTSVFISNQTTNSITVSGVSNVTAGIVSTYTSYGGSQTVSASDVTSGTLTITENGTSDCTNYKNVTVNVSGGGGATVGTGSVTNSSNTATSLSFTGLEAEPVAFFVRVTTTITSSGNSSYYYVASMRYNGSNTYGTYMRVGSTRGIYNDTSHYSYTYSNGTLTVRSSASRSAAGGSFYNGTYELTYVY